MNIIELAKEAAQGNPPSCQLHNAMLAEAWAPFLKRFAALVRAEREWVDITKAEQLYLLASHIDKLTGDVMGLSLIDAVIAAFKEKNK